MSAIDVGAPTYTSRAGVPPVITGTNLSTAMRLFLWDDNFGGIAEEDAAIFFATPSGIHAQTGVTLQTPTIDTAHGYLNLHMLNPLGYNNKPITQALLDYLFEQLHVGKGVVRMSPNGHGTLDQWAASAFGSPWGMIHEPMSAPDFSTYMKETTAGHTEDLVFPPLPSNALRVSEAIVAFFGTMTKGPSGSDEGLGFGFQLKHGTLGNISRNLIADMYANGLDPDGKPYARKVKLERIDQLPGVFNASWLAVTAERGLAGPSPNPEWRVYALEMVVYYENNDPSYDIIDLGAHSSLDTAFAAHLLDFDLIDTTGYAGLLDILAHAPQLFYYIDYRGQLVPAAIGAYADAISPRALSTIDGTIIDVRRGPYRVDERYANAVELRWGIQIPHTSGGSATEDPTNQPSERGDRKYLRGANGIPVAGWEDRKILDRHFIRRDSNKDVAEAAAKMYLHLWGEEDGEDVEGLDISCPYACVDVEPGDVVTVTVPNLGLAARFFLCVEKTFDLENDRLNLTLYDVENTL